MLTSILPLLLQLAHADDADTADEVEEIGFVVQRVVELLRVPLRDGPDTRS